MVLQRTDLVQDEVSLVIPALFHHARYTSLGVVGRLENLKRKEKARGRGRERRHTRRERQASRKRAKTSNGLETE